MKRELDEDDPLGGSVALPHADAPAAKVPRVDDALAPPPATLVDARAPSGLSLDAHNALRSAASTGVSPASSFAVADAPRADNAAAAPRWPLTAAQCNGERPHASRRSVALATTPPFASHASNKKSIVLADAPARAATCKALCPSSSTAASALARLLDAPFVATFLFLCFPEPREPRLSTDPEYPGPDPEPDPGPDPEYPDPDDPAPSFAMDPEGPSTASRMAARSSGEHRAAARMSGVAPRLARLVALAPRRRSAVAADSAPGVPATHAA